MNNKLTVSWFSAGVSSAVATKLAINDIDRIIYIDIDDHHEDNKRFISDCEYWFEREIETIKSPYENVNNALLGAGGDGYVNGPYGAPCTRLLKRRVRKEWEIEQGQQLEYIWGMDISEIERANGLRESMPESRHIFPLIENKISKEESHRMLKAAGIKRPVMYDLGYHNNNCIGCVKGGMGYWNKIKVDFPDVFELRAKVEREIGGTCIKGVYLDELREDQGRHESIILDDCGIFCELMANALQV